MSKTKRKRFRENETTHFLFNFGRSPNIREYEQRAVSLRNKKAIILCFEFMFHEELFWKKKQCVDRAVERESRTVPLYCCTTTMSISASNLSDGMRSGRCEKVQLDSSDDAAEELVRRYVIVRSARTRSHCLCSTNQSNFTSAIRPASSTQA